MFVAVLLLALVAVEAFQPPSALTKKRYDGYKVYKVIPQNRQTVEQLHDMMLQDYHLDFWQEPSRIGAPVTFMVPPERTSVVETQLRKNAIEWAIEIEDFQTVLTPMWNHLDLRRQTADPFVYDNNEFNTLDDINAWMADLVNQCRAGLICELYSIGDSYEGRPINLFKISQSGSGRTAYWLDGTIHAREWLATATVTNILYHLAVGGDSDAVRLTDAYDWYIVPVVNPDGYQYTWDSDRMWRKNRRPNAGSACIGTDLNRNFDFRWGNDGSSHVPCSDTYCGESGGSEPETQAVSNELVRIGSTVNAMVTNHAYGQMWMFPWGNTVNFEGQECDLADDHDDMMAVANAAADAIEATYNTRWDRGNSCVVIYATTGGTDDYAKGAAGIKYAFCPELRGNGFVVLPENIALSFTEVWNGVVAMCDSINA